MERLSILTILPSKHRYRPILSPFLGMVKRNILQTSSPTSSITSGLTVSIKSKDTLPQWRKLLPPMTMKCQSWLKISKLPARLNQRKKLEKGEEADDEDDDEEEDKAEKPKAKKTSKKNQENGGSQ